MKHWMLVAALICFGSIARAAKEPTHTDPNSNPQPYLGNLTYFGNSAYRVESSTPSDTPVLLASGPGYLYGIACSSGSTGDFALGADSASASGLTINSQGKFFSPAVLTSANGSTTCTAQAVCGQWTPAGGSLRFHNGLAAIKHGSGNANCQFFALTDAEIAAASTH